MHRSLIALALAISAASIGYTILAAARLQRLAKRPKDAVSSSRPTVTVLKPLAGVEAELFENLCSFVDQAYPQVQVIFGVADANDPAIEIAQRVIARFPDADLSLVVGDGTVAANPKIANLSAMIEHAKYDLLVAVDADMRVDSAYIDSVAAAFDDPRVGAVTALYCGVPIGGLASQLGASYINEQFAPSVLVANLVEPLTYCFGSTMAVRRSVLEEIGGLGALGTHIGDDYVLGKLVTERGYRVALAPCVVHNIVYEPDVRTLAEHELRWARTIRAQRPLGYATLFVTQPVLCAALIVCATAGSLASWIAFAAAFASRVLLADAARRAFPASRPPMWSIPMRDALTAAVWIGGFFARSVRWRDRRYSIGRDGNVATSLQQMHQNSPTRCKT